MADEIKVPEPKTDARKKAIQAYHDAATREAKAEVVKQYPFLAEIYSQGNHS